MPMGLDINQRTVFELLSGKKSYFLIPDYQRPYAWEEAECATLWSDIHSFAFPDNDYSTFNENDRTRLALRNSDFILIPVRPDSYSTMPFSQIHKEAENYKKLFQFPIVKVGFDGKIPSRIADEKITELTSKGLIVIGSLPLYSTITANISSDRKKCWFVGLQAQARRPFESIYTWLELLHRKLLAIKKPPPIKKQDEKIYGSDSERGF